LTINNLNNFKKQEDYLKAYNDRCYFGSGVFSGQCALAGAIAANANEEDKKSLLKFAELYGTALHQINDLADYFPGEERQSKLYQDNFCDFKNGRLTLPLYLLLHSHNPITAQKILVLNNKKDGLLPKNILELQMILLKEGVVRFSKELTKEKFREAKTYLKDFKQSDSRGLLSTLLSVLDSNKFYHRISQIPQ
jgi:geranylgeranyl pyrophosphate synthase